MNRLWIGGSVIAVAFLAACGVTDATPIDADRADLKVVHAAASLSSVDVELDGAPLITGLTYGRSSGIMDVLRGDHQLRIRSGGAIVRQLNLHLDHGLVYAVTLSSDTAQVAPSLPDTGQAASNRANIRIINVASPATASGTFLKVLLNFPGVSADSLASFRMDASVARHGTLMYFDPGHFRARLVTDDGGTTLATVEFDVAAGGKRALVVERSAGDYVLKVIVED